MSVLKKRLPSIDSGTRASRRFPPISHSQAYSKMAARDARQPAPWRIVGEVSCLLQSNPEVGEI